MACPIPQGGHNKTKCMFTTSLESSVNTELNNFLWPPIYSNGQAIILSSCGFFVFFFLPFSSLILSCRTLDVYHISTHGVALVRI